MGKVETTGQNETFSGKLVKLVLRFSRISTVAE
jgi:hypothetical protein